MKCPELLRSIATPLCLGLTCSAMAANPTEDANRKGKVETFFTGTYLFGDETDIKAPPGVVNFSEKVKYDHLVSGGLGIGYNFTDHFSVSLALNFGQADTEVTTLDTRAGATPVLTKQTTDCFAMGGDVLVDYHVFTSRLTPVLEGGIGLRGIWDVPRTREPLRTPNGPDVNHVDSFFVASGGGGLRWDITEHWFAKAVYKVGYWVPLNDDVKDGLFVHGPTLTIGYAF